MQEGPVLVDLLQPRRYQNDLSFVMKTFQPKLAYVQHRHCVNPLIFRYRVLTDPDIDIIIREVHPNELASHRFQRINEILQEIGCLKSLSIVRSLGFVLLKIVKKVMESIFINEAKLLAIRSAMGKNPVIFVPTHRSYADFILMAFICFNYDIDIPVVVSAIDFHAMFGIAGLLRQCGAMYMRRSFKKDRVYSAIFKKYVQTVITEGDSPFEFFIEGTRSRCGKSLMPKLGILKMIVDVYSREAVSDVTFVPISINYDRLMEDSLFAREMVGIPKPKESTKGLLRGISLLEQQYGNIYINVRDAISLKEFCNYEKEDLLPMIAQTIVRKQQQNLILTYSNLLSTVIISQLMYKNINRLPITFLKEEVTKLKNVLVAFGACVPWSDGEKELTRAVNIHSFLIFDQGSSSIQIPYIGDFDSFRKDVFNTAITLISLQHYSNPCYHFLVNAAILIVIMKVKKQLSKDLLFQKYHLFRRLFKHEFLFYEAFAKEDFENAYNTLRSLNVLDLTPENEFKLNTQLYKNQFVWFNLMLPYMRGYLFVYQSLLQLTPRTLDPLKLTARIRKQLELELEVCNEMCLFYCFSSSMMSCALSSLLDAGILQTDKCENSFIVSSTEQLKDAASFLSSFLGRSDRGVPLTITSNTCKL